MQLLMLTSVQIRKAAITEYEIPINILKSGALTVMAEKIDIIEIEYSGSNLDYF